MKFSRLLLLVPAALALVLAAQAQQTDDQDQQQQQPPEQIPDFSNLDEYIYVPKSTVNFGYRYITGVRARFSGSGVIGAPEALPATAPNVSRTYHDGGVGPDGRTVTEDDANGTTSTVALNGADGKTNDWTYTDPSQITSDGFLQENLYSVQSDNYDQSMTGKGNVGMEVFATHDERQLGKHWSWKLFGGFSLSDIQAATFATVRSTVTTITDTYDLYGQIPPAPPYLSGSGSGQILVSSAPLTRTATSAEDDVDTQDHYKLHGGYATFRFGPQLVFSPNDHLQLLISVGPAVVMAGSTYTVTEVFDPPTGAQEIATLQRVTNRLLPGFYVDATLQYDLSDRSGFYLGIFDQSAGSYNENVQTAGQAVLGGTSETNLPYYTGNTIGPGDYDARVDFTNQTGLRTGMAYKF